MKKIAFAGLLAVALFMTSCSSHDWMITQTSFQSEELISLSPYGLEYGKPLGKNWWEGTFRDQKVIIHAVVTNNYVNVDFFYEK